MITILTRHIITTVVVIMFAGSANASIKIGMVLPLSGALSATGNDIVQGSKAAVDAINKAGGIKGQQLELLIEDDRFDAKLSEELARAMIKSKGVSALMSCFGTVSCLAVGRVAQETGVPLIGPIAGAEALRDAKFTKIYSVRASASEEVGVLLNYLLAIKQNNASVVIQDDGFGQAYAASLLAVSSKYDFKPAQQLVFDPKTPNYKDIAKKIIAKTDAPAVLLIANTQHSVGIVKALAEEKYYGQVLNLAGQANGGFVKGLANVTQFAVFSTVTPSPFSESSPAAQAYRADWKLATGNDHVSYIGFESYLNVQVLIAALKRSANFSSVSIDLAISQLNKVNYFELKYSFAAKSRQAANFTDLAVLSNGTFKH
jgi:branched-chain amino acid transport system substrate-binding protein